MLRELKIVCMRVGLPVCKEETEGSTRERVATQELAFSPMREMASVYVHESYIG